MKEKKTHVVADLLKNIRQYDDEKSFEELFQLFYQRLLNFSIQYVDDKETAEEIVSDVFAKLWINRKKTEYIHNPEVYLFIAVKNQSLNHLKRFSNYKVAFIEETGIHQLINTHSPEKELERKELFFKINQAIDSLPKQCKIIFNLVKEEGLKYKEVAAILNISPRTVETQLVRAMKKLDKILAPYLNSQPPNSKRILPVIKSFLFLFY